MKTKTLPIAIIFLAIIIALGILFVKNNDQQEADNAPESNILTSANDQPSEKPTPIETNKEITEFDKRQEIRNQYQSYGKETGFAIVFKKPIDKTFLLANQYEFSSNKYYADTNTNLNTSKLTEVSAIEFSNVIQAGIDLKSQLKKNPTSVTREKSCTNIKLDNGGYSSFCDPTGEEYGVYNTYLGLYEKFGLHLLSYAIEESSSFFISQKDGNRIDVTFHNHILNPDKTILVSYNPEFGGGYTQGGISVIDFKDYVSKNILQVYGGYAGFERWGVEEVKIDESNIIYFKTVAYTNTHNSAGELEKTYSYFKQEIK